MVFLGVPILDWVLLAVLLALGVEAYVTCRTKDDDKDQSASKSAASTDAEGKPMVQDSDSRP